MSSTPVYIELKATVEPLLPFRDVFIAALGELGFNSFTETEMGFCAYIPKEEYNEAQAKEALQWDGVTVQFTTTDIAQVNWNKQWEENFQPIDVDGRVYIHAPFHTVPEADYEHVLLIEPKMSFGTGHHETTHMMMQWLLEDDAKGCKTLDMGCGTGLLGILAAQRGAQSVEGIDIDTWCIENTVENAARNNVGMTAVVGGAEAIQGNYDLILANINLNVLLADMATYGNALIAGGRIYFSGFYEENIPALESTMNAHGMKLVGVKAKGKWRSVKAVKE